MATNDAVLADRLNLLLDAIADGEPAWSQRHVRDELELAATVAHVRALDDAPGADPRFAQRLLRTLLADTSVEERTMIAFTRTLPHVPALPVVQNPPPTRILPAPLWKATAFATTALVLLIVAVSLVIVRPDQNGGQIVAPVILPARSGTPENPGPSLLHVVLPETSADRAFVSLERYSLPAAASMNLDMRVGNTPTVSYLVEGEVQASLGDASPQARVIRAGEGTPEAVLAPGKTATLAAGDALVLPEKGTATITNESAAPAEVLLLFQPANVPAVLSTAGEFATLGTQVHTISGELTLDFRQETLAPGSSIARSGDPQVVQIAGALDPNRVMDVRTASGGALRNAGDDPLEVYVVTVTSAGPLP